MAVLKASAVRSKPAPPLPPFAPRPFLFCDHRPTRSRIGITAYIDGIRVRTAISWPVSIFFPLPLFLRKFLRDFHQSQLTCFYDINRQTLATTHETAPPLRSSLLHSWLLHWKVLSCVACFSSREVDVPHYIHSVLEIIVFRDHG